MKGYFTKLMDQTRLPGQAAGKSRPTTGQFISPVPVTVPHVIDRRAEITSDRQPFFNSGSSGVISDTETMDEAMVHGAGQTSLDKSDQGRKERNMSDKVPFPKDIPARAESTGTEESKQSRLQAKSLTFSTAPDSLPTQENTAVPDFNPAGATQTGFEAGGREHDSTLSVGIGHREHAGHDVAKQVREWVAAKPSGGDADDHSDSGILNRSSGRITSSSMESNVSHGDPSKPRGAHQQYLETENQELHLSIGSISFTIEEPAAENQRPERARVSRDTTPVRDRGSSRLSRHYLRIK
jgi:hypothetical protein